VIVPRFTTRLCTAGSGVDWKETELLFDKNFPTLTDALTGRILKSGSDTLSLKDLNSFPFAVFHNLSGA
jgi:hypothetical protein